MDIEDAAPRVWWKPADDRGPACLSIEVNGLKKYRRIWSPGGADELVEWGWVVSGAAVELAPRRE
jgi:hypothetical protein